MARSAAGSSRRMCPRPECRRVMWPCCTCGGPALGPGTRSFGIPSPAGPPLPWKGIISVVADGRQTCPALQDQAQFLSSEALSQLYEQPEGMV